MVGRVARGLIAALVLTATACGGKPTEFAVDKTCWVKDAAGRLSPLDYDVQNLETCGARLELLYIQFGEPAAGVYGGVEVFVTHQATEAGTPYGRRLRLINQTDRDRLDSAIRLLLERQPNRARVQAG